MYFYRAGATGPAEGGAGNTNSNSTTNSNDGGSSSGSALFVESLLENHADVYIRNATGAYSVDSDGHATIDLGAITGNKGEKKSRAGAGGSKASQSLSEDEDLI